MRRYKNKLSSDGPSFMRMKTVVPVWHDTCKTFGGRKRIPWLLASFRDFEPPEYEPRISARTNTCTAVFTRASCVPRNREHKKRPAGGKTKMPMREKSHFSRIICSRCYTRRNLRFHVENCQHADLKQLTRR